MAYEDPNAPSSAPVTKTSAGAPPAASKSDKSSGAWDWLLPSILAFIIVKLFGIVGGLVTFGSYYLLKPKLGMWGAIAASGGIGIITALGFLAMIR